MKDKYLIWKRVTEHLKNTIEQAESDLIINKMFLEKAEDTLKRYPKPKLPPTKKPVGTG